MLVRTGRERGGIEPTAPAARNHIAHAANWHRPLIVMTVPAENNIRFVPHELGTERTLHPVVPSALPPRIRRAMEIWDDPRNVRVVGRRLQIAREPVRLARQINIRVQNNEVNVPNIIGVMRAAGGAGWKIEYPPVVRVRVCGPVVIARGRHEHDTFQLVRGQREERVPCREVVLGVIVLNRHIADMDHEVRVIHQDRLNDRTGRAFCQPALQIAVNGEMERAGRCRKRRRYESASGRFIAVRGQNLVVVAGLRLQPAQDQCVTTDAAGVAYGSCVIRGETVVNSTPSRHISFPSDSRRRRRIFRPCDMRRDDQGERGKKRHGNQYERGADNTRRTRNHRRLSGASHIPWYINRARGETGKAFRRAFCIERHGVRSLTAIRKPTIPVGKVGFGNAIQSLQLCTESRS